MTCITNSDSQLTTTAADRLQIEGISDKSLVLQWLVLFLAHLMESREECYETNPSAYLLRGESQYLIGKGSVITMVRFCALLLNERERQIATKEEVLRGMAGGANRARRSHEIFWVIKTRL